MKYEEKNIKLFNADCFEILKTIEDDSVDLVLIDPPYGTVKGLRENLNWDEQLDMNKLISEISRVLKKNKVAAIFCQEPFSSKIILAYHQQLRFKQKLIWKKNQTGNALNSKRAHCNFYEEIILFQKKYSFNADLKLREYSRVFKKYIDQTKIKELKLETKYSHFLSSDGLQFNIPTEKNYNFLVELFDLKNRMKEDFLSYEEMYNLRDDLGSVFNLDENQKQKSNVLEFRKPKKHQHPTQKPILLLEEIIKTFTNENDIVLDFTMGSGSTAVASKNLNRKFIGVELSEEYFNVAVDRVKNESN